MIELFGGNKVDNQKKYPRVLVISNNPFSKTSNNGKTLASFFKEFPMNNIAQLYFSSELPSKGLYKNYFRISDIQVLKSIYSSKSAGNIVNFESNEANNVYGGTPLKYISSLFAKSNFFRLIRELMWKSNKWKSDDLVKWIKNFSPEIVFFCAGDSGFAYDIVSFVLDITNSKLIIYITDDYILPRRTISFLWWLRRSIIFKKMNKAILNSSLFITISEEMRREYKDIFGKDSIIALNMTESMKIENIDNNNIERNIINLIYAGGMHFKRYSVLALLAKAIKKYNNQSINLKAYLNIYSASRLPKSVLNKLNLQGTSKFMGGIDIEELKIKLNEADILIHVESFDFKSIESTRLSVSTKIPEYLSLGKPILAVGPSKVASMKFLNGVAHCIYDKKEIYNKLRELLDDTKLQIILAKKALKKYEEVYNCNNVKKLTKSIIDIFCR